MQVPFVNPGLQYQKLKNEILSKFDEIFYKSWNALSLKKIGISNPKPDDEKLFKELLDIMATEHADFTQTFLQLNPLTKKYNFSETPIRLNEWKKKWESRIGNIK